MTKVQEEACNLLSALASFHANHVGILETTATLSGEWSERARDLAYDMVMETLGGPTHEQYAEAEAMIRDRSVR